MSSNGWIKIHRKITEHWLFDMESINAFGAWIDLLISVNYEESETTIAGKHILVARGQKLTSILKLANRWKKGRKWVSTFLNNLEKSGMISQKRTNRFTLITVCNYEQYQAREEHQTAHHREHQTNPVNTKARTPYLDVQEHHTEHQGDYNIRSKEERKDLKPLCRVTRKKITSPVDKSQAEELLKFLNSLTGKKFRAVETTLKPIIARLESGVSFQQCKTMIAYMHGKWMGDETMERYLRPVTLFGKTKFENYLAECTIEEDGDDN